MLPIGTSFIYHFFPHYRRGVIEELGRRLDSIFIGDAAGTDGIRPHTFTGNDNFQSARCFYFGRFAFQPFVPWYCLIADQNVFVFLANPNLASTWLGAVIARVRGKRVIFWGHGFKSSKKSLKNVIRKLFFSLSHAFYSYGWRAKQNAISLGFEPSTIYVGFNSLNYSSQLPLRQRLLSTSPAPQSSSSAELKVFCISRLTKPCRYDLLLDAAAETDRNGVNCRIIFVGDGSEREALEQQARVLELDVEFLGEIYDEERIAELVFAADVTVSPGKVGLTAMHSLMFGTPVITHDNFVSQMPEVEAIVPSFTGEFFQESSVQGLARTLSSFSTLYPDRELTRSRCFEMIDKIYNPAKQADVMLKAVQGLPAERGDDAFTIFDNRTP